jgi:hypothetical protein
MDALQPKNECYPRRWWFRRSPKCSSRRETWCLLSSTEKH